MAEEAEEAAVEAEAVVAEVVPHLMILAPFITADIPGGSVLTINMVLSTVPLRTALRVATTTIKEAPRAAWQGV